MKHIDYLPPGAGVPGVPLPAEVRLATGRAGILFIQVKPHKSSFRENNGISLFGAIP